MENAVTAKALMIRGAHDVWSLETSPKVMACVCCRNIGRWKSYRTILEMRSLIVRGEATIKGVSFYFPN